MSADRIIFRDSKKVALTLLNKTDLPFIMQNINGLEMNQYLLTGRFPLGEAFEEKWLSGLYNEKVQTNVPLAVITLPEMQIVGCMGLHSIDLLNRTATTGAWITSAARNKKIGREAKMVLLRYAFVELGLRTIRSSVLGFNERSHRYLLATGYKEIGRAKDWHRNPVTGEYTDEILMQLMREDWLPLYEKWKTENGE
jgi:RimJ/RimL family protein N-acetyltransferase